MIESVSVVGVGRLGICLSLSFASKGFNVKGVDNNAGLVMSINDGSYKTSEPLVLEFLQKYSSKLSISINIKDALSNDIIFIVVPTPSLPDSSYDHSAIESVVNEIVELGVSEAHKLLVICCTTMPGYCAQLQEKVAEYNYSVSYNPEFIAQGAIMKGMMNPDIVLIGESTTEDGDILEYMYTKMCENKPTICRMSLTEAEITKISINCFITTKIAFANMIGDYAIQSGFSPDNVLHAIGCDSRIGGKYLKWGYGFGGPCFPRDNRALSKSLQDHGIYSVIPTATDESNKLHLSQQVKHFVEKNPLPYDVLLNSVTYKPDSIILEESQQLEFAKKLAQNGYDVTIQDKQCVIAELEAVYGNIFKYKVI